MCLLKAHFINLESVFISHQLIEAFVGLVELSPFGLCNEILFVDSEEENENETTCTLNVTEVFDGIYDPIFDVKLSVMILSWREKEDHIDENTNYCWEVLQRVQSVWSDHNDGLSKSFIVFHLFIEIVYLTD